MATKEGPLTVSQAQYARMRGVSPQLVNRKVLEGVIHLHGPRKLIDVQEADAALVDASALSPGHVEAGQTKLGVDSIRGGAQVASAKPTLYESRAERARIEAERSRVALERESLALAELKAGLVGVDAVRREWIGVIATVRNKLLGVPVKIKQAIPELSAGSVARIDSIIREAMTEIATGAETRRGGKRSGKRKVGKAGRGKATRAEMEKQSDK